MIRFELHGQKMVLLALLSPCIHICTCMSNLEKYMYCTVFSLFLCGKTFITHIIPCSLIYEGAEAVDWLIRWYFVTSRQEAVMLCNSMLTNGLFYAIAEEESSRNGLIKSSIAEDKQACNIFQDSNEARYIFVSEPHSIEHEAAQNNVSVVAILVGNTNSQLLVTFSLKGNFCCS